MTNSQSEAPIFVTGMPRSGTTFVQNLLSSHPEIEIHGQEPRFFVWESWLRAAVEGVDFAADANAGLEDVCRHYAAPEDADEAIRRMLQFVRWYLTGGQESRRWGVKSLADCRQAADLIQRVWPLARWVVCIRNPFRSLSSLRNTFDISQRVKPLTAARWWTEAAVFGHLNSAARPVFIDRLTAEPDRHEFAEELLAFVGEPVTSEVREFVDRWPVIHKVVPDSERTATVSPEERRLMLNGDREFQEWVERLGFSPACGEMSA